MSYFASLFHGIRYNAENMGVDMRFIIGLLSKTAQDFLIVGRRGSVNVEYYHSKFAVWNCQQIIDYHSLSILMVKRV